MVASSGGGSGKPATTGRGGGGLGNLATAATSGGAGWGQPAMVATNDGGGGSGNPAKVARSGGGGGSGKPATVASRAGDRSVKPPTSASGGDGSSKPATVASSSGDRSVKPPTTASGGGSNGSVMSATVASRGGSSANPVTAAMQHGIEIPEGMDPALSFLLTVRMDAYQVALDGSMRRCSEFDYPRKIMYSKPASLTCNPRKHAYHLKQMYSKPKVQEYLEAHHTKIWARSKFNQVCKVDYVNNNLAESFNSKLKKVKALQIVDMFDCLRQRSIVKFELRRRITEKLEGHRILPAVVKALNEKTRGLNLTCLKHNDYEAEVAGTDKEGRQWRYPVDIKNKTCSCMQWQITGLPCIHALKFITSLRGPPSDIESYVHEFYSVAKFKATYAENLPAMVGKEQWEPYDPGFKLCAPLMKRPPGRPRTKRIRARSEGGRLGARKIKCRRCGAFGHIQRTCKESVDPAFGEEGYGEPEQEPEPHLVASSASSRKGAKKAVKKNTTKKRKSPDSTNVDASAAGSVSLDSPAKNTRSKTASAQDSPAKNTRNKKKLCL